MKTCVRHGNAVVVYPDTQDSCPICEEDERERELVRERERKGVDVLPKEVLTLKSRIRVLKDEVERSINIRESLREELMDARLDRQRVGKVSDGFVECDVCKEKPGTPLLCDSCYLNRRTIAGLNRANKLLLKSQNEMRELWKEIQLRLVREDIGVTL